MRADSPATFTLAEEFFLIAHDDHTGRALLDADSLAAGLAGAVLAGLVLAGRITIAEGQVTLQDERATGDPIGDPLLVALRRQSDQRTVDAWLDELRDGLTTTVAEDLAARGLIRPVLARHPLVHRRRVRYPAVDAARAVAPRARLGSALGRAAPVDGRTAVLAEIVRATGLARWFIDVYGPSVRDQLARVRKQVPASVQTLAAAIERRSRLRWSSVLRRHIAA
ncbi:MAG TPA: GPP34 family phosphoprotein [Micromonospora sp.]